MRVPSSRLPGDRIALLAGLTGEQQAQNHPDSLPPSASDIRSLISNRARRGIIACHDGSLYVFEIVGNPVPGYTIDNDRIDRISKLWGNDEVRLLRAFENELGVHVEHIC